MSRKFLERDFLALSLAWSCYQVALATYIVYKLGEILANLGHQIDVGFSSGDTTILQYLSGNKLWSIPYFRHGLAVSNKFERASLFLLICSLSASRIIHLLISTRSSVVTGIGGK